MGDPAEANQIYGIAVKREVAEVDYDAAVLAVAHREFVAKGGAAIRGALQGCPYPVRPKILSTA